MKFTLNKYNHIDLLAVAELVKQNKSKELEIILDKKNTPFFGGVVGSIYKVLDNYERYFQIRLKDFPFCAVSNSVSDHIFFDNFKGEKSKECKECKWGKRCGGFPKGYFNEFGAKELCSFPDLPVEVMVEVTSRCNFKCNFCFNNISFAKHGRNIKPFSSNYLKKIIDCIFDAGIKTIRFTGGEPFLRKDIFSLLKYAKEKGLEVRLNTNGYLVDKKVAQKMKGVVDNVLIPVESWVDKKEEKITGVKGALRRKIEAIDLLRKEGKISVIRVGTVATKENILNFEKIAKLINGLDIDEWEFYRPVPVLKKEVLNSELIKNLVDHLDKFRKETGRVVFIANSLPFCAIKDKNKVNIVSKGGLFDDGHSRLVIDPRGFVKPHYFMNEKIGDPLDILSAWNNPFMKKIRNLENIPEECKRCFFVSKCRGGSRHAAMLVNGDIDGFDPLVNRSFCG